MFNFVGDGLSSLSDFVYTRLTGLVTARPTLEDPLADLSEDEDDMPREASTRHPRESQNPWAGPVPILKDRLRRKKEKVAATEGELREAKEEISTLNARLKTLQDERDVLQKERDNYTQENKALVEKITKAYGHIRHQNKELTGYEETRARLAEVVRELDACRRQMEAGASLLEVRSAELRDAQQYLSKPDSMSYAEVNRLVETLNAEIFQTAASVTDEFTFGQACAFTEKLHTAYEKVSYAAGAALTHAVSTRSHKEDAILVQMLVQAVLAERVHWAIGCWSPYFTYDENSLLTKIHKSVSAAGEL
jgi:chromosome segregation ATPase